MSETALTVPPAGPQPLALSPGEERLLDAFLAGRSPATLRAYRQDLADFAAFVGVPDVEEALQRLLATPHGQANGVALAYRADMVTRQLAPATVNRRLSALRSVVQLGAMLGRVTWRLAVENVDRAAYRDTRGPGRDGVRALFDAAKDRGDDKGVRDQALQRLLHDVDGGGRAILVGELAVGRAIGWRTHGEPSAALAQRSRVDRVEADGVEEPDHGGLGGLVVAGDRQRAAVGGARRAGKRAQVLVEDVVEDLDHVSADKVLGEQLAARGRVVVQHGDVAVAGRVVVARVEHGLADQRLDGHGGVGAQRHAHHDEVADGGRLGGRRRAGLGP